VTGRWGNGREFVFLRVFFQEILKEFLPFGCPGIWLWCAREQDRSVDRDGRLATAHSMLELGERLSPGA